MDTCAQCGNPLSVAKQRRHAKFCSGDCSRTAAREAWRRDNPRLSIATATVGTIGELNVGADLLRKGYEVFRALSPACSCDLAVLKAGKLLRVEVTTGYRTKSGRLAGPAKKHPHDVLALVVNGTIHYRPCL